MDWQQGRPGLFVYGYQLEIDPETLRKGYTIDRAKNVPLRLFVRGEAYEMWGFIHSDRHLFGVAEGGVYLLGTDRLGRDMFTRILYGSRVSLSIGLVGVALSLVVGVLLGGVSGYLGGGVDNAVQRLIEMLRSIPTIPLWLGLSAAVPSTWPPLRVYLAITIILSLIGWTGLARVVRGKLLSLREEDFVLASRVCGASGFAVIIRHLIPGFLSYIIVSLTLSIPAMILGRDQPQLPGTGAAPAGHQLGRAAQGGAERIHRCAVPVADDSSVDGHRHRDLFQLRRRRTARRRRSIPLIPPCNTPSSGVARSAAITPAPLPLTGASHAASSWICRRSAPWRWPPSSAVSR